MSETKILTLEDIENQPEVNKDLGYFMRPENRHDNIAIDMADAARRFPVSAETLSSWSERAEDPFWTRQGKGFMAGLGRTWDSFGDMGANFKNLDYRYVFPDSDEEESKMLMEIGLRNQMSKKQARAYIEHHEGTDDSIMANISGGLASALAYGGAGLAAGAIGGPGAAVAVIGGLSGAQMGLEKAEEFAETYAKKTGDYSLENYDKTNDLIALGYGAVGGWIETKLGAERIIADALGRSSRATLRRAALGFVEEGAEEYLQEYAGGVAGKIAGLEDRTWEELLKDSLISGVYGAVVGGIVGGGMYYYHRGRLAKLFHDAGFDKKESRILADNAIDNTKSKILKEVSTVTSLEKHFGSAYNDLIGKIESALDAAGWDKTQIDPKTKLPRDKHEYAKAAATDIAYQVLRQAKINKVPVSDILDLADIVAIKNVLYLKPKNLGTIENIEALIKQKKAEKNALIKSAQTMAGDSNRKSLLNTQIAVLQNLLDLKKSQLKAKQDARPQELKDRSELAKADAKVLEKSDNVADFAQNISKPDQQVTPVEAKKRHDDATLMWLLDGDKNAFESLIEIGNTGNKVLSGILNSIENIYQFQKENPDIDLRADIQGALKRLPDALSGNFAEYVSLPSNFNENALLYAFAFGSADDINTFLNKYMDKIKTNKENGKFQAGTFRRCDAYAQCLKMFKDAFDGSVAKDVNMRGVMLSMPKRIRKRPEYLHKNAQTIKQLFDRRINLDFARNEGILQALGYDESSPVTRIHFPTKGGITDWQDVVNELETEGIMEGYADSYENQDKLIDYAKNLLLNTPNVKLYELRNKASDIKAIEKDAKIAEKEQEAQMDSLLKESKLKLTDDDLKKMSFKQKSDKLAELYPTTIEDVTPDLEALEEWDNAFWQEENEVVRPETVRINYLQDNLNEWQKYLDETVEPNVFGWSPELIDENRKRAKKAISNIKKEIKQLQESLKEPIEDKLYATHNMSLAGVKGALKLGGLAMPSLAVRKVSQGNINQFGDIVFVGGVKMVEPSRTTDVFDRDAWTPSLAYNMKYELTNKGKDFIRDVVSKNKTESGVSSFIYNIENDIDSPKSNTMAMQLYCLDKGIDYNSVPHYELSNSLDYLTWYEEKITGNSEPYLWAENADNTDMKKYKYTLDNMMRILKRQERSGGGFLGDTVLTVSHLLQFTANKYKNLKEIKQNKNKLVSREEQTAAINALDEKFYQVAEELKLDGKEYPHYENRTGLAVAAINNPSEIKENLARYNLDTSDESVEKVKQFTQQMKDVVTDYFEVKPRRIVNFNEFSGVIVPTGKEYDGVATQLEDSGLFVQRVEKGNEPAYKDALMEIQRRYKTVLFQGSKKQGMYDPELQVIIIGKDFNTGTLPHEMAHFWLDDVFRRATTYNDWTPEFIEQANNLFAILGVEENQKQLTREQHEKFARMVENVVFGLQPAPAGAELPTLAYLNWIPEKYKSIADIRYKDEDGTYHYPLLDKDAADFFNAWYSNTNLPDIGTSPLEIQNQNFTDRNGDVVPSTPEIMKLRDNTQEQAVKDQAEVDKEIHDSGVENTPTDTRAEMTGYNTQASREATTPEPVVQPQPKKKSILRIGRGTNTRAEMIEEAQKYIDKNKEHAEEIAFGDPELVENDSGIERGILIRQVMNNYKKGSQEYATLYDNLARTMSLAGKTGGLNNDMQVRFYLEGYYRLNKAMEAKAAAKYAGSNRGAITKFNQDIQAFIASKADAILATEPGSKERNDLIDAMIREAEIKFAGGTGDARMLFQENNFGQKARRQNKADFIKWADKEIKKMLKANPESDPTIISELITKSEKAQVAKTQIDSKNINESVAAAQVLREWQEYTDSLDDTVLDSQISKLNRWFRKIVGNWQPFAMLTNINTHTTNMVSNTVNLATVQASLAAQYGKAQVDSALIKREHDRIWAIYNTTQIDISQMLNPATPSLLHGEKIDVNAKNKLRVLDTRMWLGKEDLMFRSRVYLSTLAHIATKNAKASGKSANELFEQYCNLNQEAGSEAEQARQQAVLMGNIATFTQNGKFSGMLQKVRTEINKFTDPTGRAGFGTMLAPFLKTPANIVELGVRATFAPITDVAALLKKSWGMQDTLNTVYFLLAIVLSAAVDDYEKEYESGKKYDPTKPYDSVNFGGKAWFKLDLFGALETPLRFLSALKTNKGLGISGVVNATPLVGDISESISGVERASKSSEKLLSFGINYAYNQVNKSVPAIIKQTANLANMADLNLEQVDIGIKTGLGRKIGRQYGLDAQERTDIELYNDVLGTFFNRLKLTE